MDLSPANTQQNSCVQGLHQIALQISKRKKRKEKQNKQTKTSLGFISLNFRDKVMIV